MGRMTAHCTLLRFTAALLLILIAAPAPISRAQEQGDAPPEAVAEGSDAPAETPPEARVPRGLESPRAAMFTFLEAMERASQTSGRARAEALQRAARTFDISDLARESAEVAAERLLKVLNRIERVSRWDLPDEARVDQEGMQRFQFFPRPDGAERHRIIEEMAPDGVIALVRGEDGGWRFSRATISNIDSFHRRIEDFAPVRDVNEVNLSVGLRIRSMLPPALRSEAILWLEYWQWLGLVVLVFLAVVADFVLRAALRAIAIRAMRRRGAEATDETLTRTVRPLGLFGAALLFATLIWLLALPGGAMQALLPAVRFVLMVAGVWAALNITDLIAEALALKAAKTPTRFDDLLIPLIRKTVKIVILLLGLFYMAKYVIFVDPLPLLTGLGIGGLAVAFAAKDTIENFFGSVAVILDRPFEVGDWVKIGDVEGTVVELGFRSTRVRTFYDSVVTLPNASLVRATVDNLGRRRYRRTSATLSLAYDTPPDRIDAFCEAIRELVRLHPYTRKDYYNVYFNGFGAHSLDILLYVFHECPDWTTELRERHRLYLDILRIAERIGVEFAYPTQTLYLKRGGDIEPGGEIPPASIEEKASQAGRDAAHAITQNAAWKSQRPAPETLPTGPVAGFQDEAAGDG